MDLCNLSVIRELMAEAGISFRKEYGQNFLTNRIIPEEIAENCTDSLDSMIIEIGPGIGVLTAELCKRAKSVVSIELDERLRPVLAETLAEYDNLEVIFGDCMKLDIAKIIEQRFKGKKVSVCANLPYYITSPIIMKLLESRLPITSLTVMVQKEAADRICAAVSSRDAGAVTVAVNYYSSPKILFNVSRGSFMPSPNVDSSVIRLDVLKEPPICVADEKGFFRFVRAAFGQRRKTLVNAASAGTAFSKESVKKALEEAGIDQNIRAEQLTLQQFSLVFSKL